MGARVFTTLDEALRDPAVDAVYVASPVALHAPQTIASLRAGKHVLCEKPTAMNYARSRIDGGGRALECGRLLGVAYYRRLYPKLLRTRQLIAEGAIGKPVLAEANCHSWLPAEERSWLWDPALAGGGPLYDIGSHRIDAFNFLFGRPARATGLALQRGTPIERGRLRHGADRLRRRASAEWWTCAGTRTSSAISSA